METSISNELINAQITGFSIHEFTGSVLCLYNPTDVVIKTDQLYIIIIANCTAKLELHKELEIKLNSIFLANHSTHNGLDIKHQYDIAHILHTDQLRTRRRNTGFLDKKSCTPTASFKILAYDTKDIKVVYKNQSKCVKLSWGDCILINNSKTKLASTSLRTILLNTYVLGQPICA